MEGLIGCDLFLLSIFCGVRAILLFLFSSQLGLLFNRACVVFLLLKKREQNMCAVFVMICPF